MEIIKTVSFISELVLERSCTPNVEPLGKFNCTMNFIKGDSGNLFIEWESIGIDDEDAYECVEIGIWADEEKNITDYDGVFSLPKEAIELLKSAGYKTEEVE